MYTGRCRDAVMILLFRLEALFTNGSRAQLCALCSFRQTVGCYWLSCLSNQFLLAPTEIKPVYYSILSTIWVLGKSSWSTCHHPHSLAKSSFIMFLIRARGGGWFLPADILKFSIFRKSWRTETLAILSKRMRNMFYLTINQLEEEILYSRYL